MAKKQATAKAKAKVKAKPTKPRAKPGGRGATNKPPETATIGSAGEFFSAMDEDDPVLKMGGCRPFGNVGMCEAVPQAIDCILFLRFIAAGWPELDANPNLQQIRHDASQFLAEIAAIFIQEWPSECHVTPEIWQLHKDPTSGFRRCWDKIRGTTKSDDPFVDDFALNLWAFARTKHPDRMRDAANDFETCWTEILEPMGKAFWPLWTTESILEFYFGSSEQKRLQTIGWSKGKWNDRVKTACRLRAKKKDPLTFRAPRMTLPEFIRRKLACR